MTRGSRIMTFYLADDELQPLVELELHIDYTYTPGQRPDYTPPGDPGYGPEVEMRAHFVHPKRILRQSEDTFLLSLLDLDAIEAKIIEWEEEQ